jgi:hypothetical protein
MLKGTSSNERGVFFQGNQHNGFRREDSLPLTHCAWSNLEIAYHSGPHASVEFFFKWREWNSMKRLQRPFHEGCADLFFIFLMGWDWVHSVLRPLIGLLYQPRMIDDECGAVGGMRIGRGNRSTGRKPAPAPLCPLQIPRDLAWDRIRAAAVRSQRLTAWAMTRPRADVYSTSR